jgi:hypothetical protein
MNAIELLAPAKNLQSGIVAINYGADAVYIGADRFGARAAAANSVADIETLVQYAHKYKAKVFVTLNTILYDHELEEAEKLIHQIYHAGADALIIQDMGILRMKLPPIPLHASTQTNNYDPERIRFFDELGFERIVLARELSLNEIRNIRSQTKTALEFFVHGSLCVSLSGQCYFSQAVTGRSANRGMCTQISFEPDPEKSFSRGGTNYFLSGRKKNLINKYSPKSMGKKLGIVDQVGSDFITVTTNEILHNGDGLCFIFKDDLIGFRVEKVLDKKIVVNELSHLSHGTELYRNYDHEFNKILEADNSIRKVSATINVTEQDKQLEFKLCDEDHLNTVHIVNPLPEIAKDPEQAAKNLVIQLAKAGSSMFDIKEVLIDYETDYFIRISELNEIRRTLFEKHEKLRILTFARNNSKAERKSPKFSHTKVGFSENISNQKAILFYKEHGVENLEEALEISTVKEDQLLMTTRYCIKHELGFCEKLQLAKKTLPEPLYLEDQNRKYLLTFDCKHCLMQVRLNKNISLEGKSEKYKW